MASIGALAPLMDKGHEDALRVIRDHGHPEDTKTLDLIRGNAVSPSIQAPQVIAIYQAVMIGALARILEQQVKPRPRGRPRKVGG
jgi:hypothetical protein